jgi:hypothetical protein
MVRLEHAGFPELALERQQLVVLTGLVLIQSDLIADDLVELELDQRFPDDAAQATETLISREDFEPQC